MPAGTRVESLGVDGDDTTTLPRMYKSQRLRHVARRLEGIFGERAAARPPAIGEPDQLLAQRKGEYG